ncbi:MAG TPA: hypothetical protein VMM55_13940 [Thermohalobaculum sp.]|nr:hypothetical protein [Thermohalobaculum sp.]
MTLAIASEFGPVEATEQASRARVPAIGKAVRGIVGVSALVVGSAMLLSTTATASTACSGELLVAEAIVLPDLSRTT